MLSQKKNNMIEIFYDSVPSTVEQDDTILWHGTSNVSEEYLDNMHPVPFSWISKDDIEKIISLYNKIDWAGSHFGGYSVLASFSLTDFKDNSSKHVYLGETFQRSKLYATKDYAGGELIRSVYYSIQDLIAYSKDVDVRTNHYEEFQRENEATFSNKPFYTCDISPDVEALSGILRKATEIRDSYNKGLIYGYKILPSDYDKLLYSGFMGILLKDNLDISTKIYKLILNADEHFDNFAEDKYRLSRTIIWKERINSER